MSRGCFRAANTRLQPRLIKLQTHTVPPADCSAPARPYVSECRVDPASLAFRTAPNGRRC
jgi:hypothetical protein